MNWVQIIKFCNMSKIANSTKKIPKSVSSYEYM